MAYRKRLEDILGESKIGSKKMNISVSPLTESTDMYDYCCGSYIDFCDLGIKYGVKDLIGYGFDSKCGTCTRHYSIKFSSGTNIRIKTGTDDNGIHAMLSIGLDISINNGADFCKYLFNSLNNTPEMKDHFQQYGYNGSKFWVFDNRMNFSLAQDGLFYTSFYKLVDFISAEYIGPPIWLYSEYNKNDVIVTVHYKDSEYIDEKYEDEELWPEDFNVSTLIVNNKPEQDVEVKWIGTNYYTNFTVPAIYITKFTAEYLGPYIYIVGNYLLEDVVVNIEYNYPEYNHILTPDEFYINSFTVENLGINNFIVTEKISKKNNMSTNLIVIGICNILDMRAKYIGPPIEVTNKYDDKDVIVELDIADENYENKRTIFLKYGNEIYNLPNGARVTQQYCIEYPGLTITEVGDNIRTIQYIDPTIELNEDIIIQGIPKLVDFETTYIGETRIIGERIYKSEVLAIASYIIDMSYTLETYILKDEEWEFYDIPIINDINKGIIRTKYSSLQSNIEVKYNVPTTLRLRCWYEGDKIEVGKTYKYENVPTFLVFPNGDLKRLRVLDLEFSNNYVEKEGWNWYTVIYRTSYYTLSGIFAVPGYIPIKHPDLDFMVKYIDIQNNYREIDYTEKFRPKFTFDNIFIISWKQFLEEVNELMLYGLYILTAPKLTGLSNKYDQDWEVLCINKNTLKANIIKTYSKEEDLPWQKQNQLEQ